MLESEKTQWRAARTCGSYHPTKRLKNSEPSDSAPERDKKNCSNRDPVEGSEWSQENEWQRWKCDFVNNCDWKVEERKACGEDSVWERRNWSGIPKCSE